MRTRGFTLVELLIVVTLVGLLATILMHRYEAAADRARQAQVVVFMNSAYQQLRAFQLQNAYYPREVPPDEPPPAAVPRWVPYWPKSAELPFESPLDYEAWRLPDGNYWIGITWFGKNGVREGGVGAGSQYVTHGIPGQIQAIGDDLYLTIATDAQVGP